MSVDCAGQHVCEPPDYPADLSERWTCGECGQAYRAFDVHAECTGKAHAQQMLRSVPAGTLGWTTADAPTRSTRP